jgi:predicted helicase
MKPPRKIKQYRKQFTGCRGSSIYQTDTLAQLMAEKAKVLADSIEKALADKNAQDDTLTGQLAGFRRVLIHDLTEGTFADSYAQTLAYGMFAARLNDRSNEKFTRKRAAELIPLTNPFLRKFFQYIAGDDLEERISWVVDALADLFDCVAVAEILKEFGKANQDPYIHFYEYFLTAYNPALREQRGVYYTPLPVVQFIVRAVDEVLKGAFDLPLGLADNSKISRKQKNKDGDLENVEFHKVHILDPATGTGTFLSETINHIYQTFRNQQGLWAAYCAEHLLPRLHGFEILMAPYAMAHFKLDMKLKETGYTGDALHRLGVYLTNSLEEPDNKAPVLLMEKWLSDEATEASKIKSNVPVMVVMGNPPYNVSTQNQGKWIADLIGDYKEYLNEQNIQPLSDDYIKFIRFGQHYIEKNAGGILAYISNNSFLDGLIHRQMRKRLLEVFTNIYILDLHGSTKKCENNPAGGKDENVFDIQQGASINIFVKTGEGTQQTGISQKVKKHAQVFHADLYGTRKEKYDFLLSHTLDSVQWRRLSADAPYYFFVPRDFSGQEEYGRGFSLRDLFPVKANGIKTQRDDASITFSAQEAASLHADFLALSREELMKKYGFQNVRDWTIEGAKSDLEKHPLLADKILYRPFDIRHTLYTGTTKGIMGYPRHSIMRHLLSGENPALVASRQFGGKKQFVCFITKIITEISSQPFAPYSVFPLYLYPDSGELDTSATRRPNLNPEVVKELATQLRLRFTDEKENNPGTFAPVDILDYIYAVLYSPTYRKKYQEFLKIDFPRVPYPENAEKFQKLTGWGAILRHIHLIDGEAPQMQEKTQEYALYPIQGDNKTEKPEYRDGKIYLNKTQYFENVPEWVWNFYIGGYQPAQKWLKDRKGRQLSFGEIKHYQHIVRALWLTREIQEEIDKVIEWE